MLCYLFVGTKRVSWSGTRCSHKFVAAHTLPLFSDVSWAFEPEFAAAEMYGDFMVRKTDETRKKIQIRHARRTDRPLPSWSWARCLHENIKNTGEFGACRSILYSRFENEMQNKLHSHICIRISTKWSGIANSPAFSAQNFDTWAVRFAV